MKSISSYFSVAILSFFLASHMTSFSQLTSANDTANYPYWTTMMQDPNASFHATQSAFEKYWANRTDYKGNGWKVFKRWEYIQKDRVQPDGKLRPPDYVLKEFFKHADSPKSVSGNWSQVGPISIPGNATGQPNGLGRINAIGFHPTDANTFYIGSPSGGFWKTSNGGTTWEVLSASMPTLGVSAILVHPTTPNIIWIGTGDRDAGDAPGMGVYKSIDGGTTWNSSSTGMGNVTVGMLIMIPSDPNIILAATNSGIYKTINGGSTWTLKSSNSSFKDIKFKPGDPTIVYATENGKFYRSTNTGDSWTQISIPVSGSRLVIGVTPANSSYVYVMQTNGVFAGILRSTDSGLTFTIQSTSPNIMDYACDGSGTSSQAWYDLCIAVDPVNADVIYLGGINIWKSINGGVALTINSHWVGSSWGSSCAPSVHADIHALNFSPVDGKLYTGCDGGIYRTTNGGTTWTDISSGLAIAQVYKIGQSATVSGLTINGYQDNGTATNNGSTFTTVIGGDGMECIIDYTNSNYRYGSLYNGIISRSTGSGYSTIAAHNSNGITETGGWVTPYILHHSDPNTMFIGYQNVWRSNNVKTAIASSVTWTMISSGETYTCNVLEQSPANVNILYVVRSGQMKRTDNANAATPAWTSCTLPGGYTPTDVKAHPTLPNVVYATAQYKVYKSTDYGVTWTNISGNLPSVYVNCIYYDKNTNEGLYVGTETSIYYKDATMNNWVSFNNGMPVVDVRELELYYDATLSNNKIKAATYGRGLWQSSLIETGVLNPSNLAANPVSPTQINTTWTKNANNNDVMLAWSPTATFGTPVTGTTYTAGNSIPGGGTVIYTGSASSFSHTGLTQNTLYYYTAWSYDGTHKYSIGSGVDTTTLCGKISTFPWSEGFENGGTSPGCWTQEQINNSGINWSFITGNGSSNPATAHSGTYNACLKDATAAENKTKLITPSLDITSLFLPTITFWHTQQVWSADQDQLIVYYKTTAGGSWVVLATYSNSLTSWTQEVINLPNVSNDYFIAFEGNAKYGYGICIDDVLISGTTPTLAVTPANQSVNPPAGSKQFTVISNSQWTVSSDQSWCTVTPSGNGNGTITANYTVNNTSSSRVANITVTVTGLTPIIVTVTQAAPTLSVSPANQPVTYIAGITSFTVTSNTNWTASSDQTWCTVTSSGNGNGSITATYTDNLTFSPRIANVTVTVTGLSPVVVTVTQDAAPAPEYNYTIANDVQTSDRTLEFDLYLLDTQPSVPLELSIIQAGILVNNAIAGGGTVTASIISGSSELVTPEQPTVITWATGTPNACIKIAPKAGPGCGSGTIISTTGLGTRICRVRITNSIPFASGTQANMAFSFNLTPYATRVFQYSGTPCASNVIPSNTTNCFSLASNPVLNGPPSLSVSPSDRPVSSVAGTTTFAVTSNASWTASSNQSWCTVTPSGFGSGTITANYSENTDASARVANVTVTVATLTPVVVTVSQAGASIKTFNLTVFLEGLYTGLATMRSAMDESGSHWGPTIADMLTIELHDGVNYSTIVYTASNVALYTNGTASFTLPSTYNGNYYVTILNRNHFLTTTALPVSFSTSVINYNFDALNKAYGDNLLLFIDGRYAIYAGDENQDGNMDGYDLADIGNMVDAFASGYIKEDITGDGIMDGYDLAIAGNNTDAFIGSITP